MLNFLFISGGLKANGSPKIVKKHSAWEIQTCHRTGSLSPFFARLSPFASRLGSAQVLRRRRSKILLAVSICMCGSVGCLLRHWQYYPVGIYERQLDRLQHYGLFGSHDGSLDLFSVLRREVVRQSPNSSLNHAKTCRSPTSSFATSIFRCLPVFVHKKDQPPRWRELANQI
jgi:hypothetical protein